MDKGYVSEFTNFIDDFLKKHPEAVKEQLRGYNFQWYPEIDLQTLVHPDEDIVPDDHYGFFT